MIFSALVLAPLLRVVYSLLPSAGPVFFAAQLIGNLIIFWIALGLESFTKEMQIGTYIVVIAVALLLRVGPGVQEDQVFEDLITKPWAAAWSIVLMVSMVITAIPLIPGVYDVAKFDAWKRYAILLTVRGTAFAINLTTGRALILKAPRVWIIVSVIIKVISGAICTRAIVIQSTAVEQASFVPLNAVMTLFVNALTGIIIWEDWRVVGDWIGYIVYFCFLSLAVVCCWAIYHSCLKLILKPSVQGFQRHEKMDDVSFSRASRAIALSGSRSSRRRKRTNLESQSYRFQRLHVDVPLWNECTPREKHGYPYSTSILPIGRCNQMDHECRFTHMGHRSATSQ